MNLTETCIRRPVLATVLSLMLVLVGIISYQRLTVREYPKIEEPVVTVDTKYPGASAEIIETQVTKTLEDSLAGIDGIEVMSSISRPEQSQITLRFKLTRDPDDAASDVRDRVGRVRGQLPDEVDEPIIAKQEADAQPMLYMAFYSDRHSPMEMSDYADRYVKDRFQNLEGVATVRILGERRMAMRIWLDPERLAAYRLTPQDVENALRQQNAEIPAGRVESVNREFTVLSETDLQTPAQFENIILLSKGDDFVRLRDVGRAVIAPEDERRIVRFNGNTAVAMGVIKQATANPLDVSQGVRAILPDIIASMPEGMKISIAYDSSIFIKQSINNVYRTIGEAVILVLLVIFFFLRSWRSTVVPLVTIPVSLIGTFTIMHALGFSLNTLTLLSMVLAIGLVVDDAIVMLENIYRYIEKGLSPLEAALKGSREIAFAVIAMTITLAAVYTPVAFITGITGRMFTEFAITLAGAVIISGFIALTLSPMMCSRLLQHEKRHGKTYEKIEGWMVALHDAYELWLAKALARRGFVVTIGLVVAVLSGVFLWLLQSELAPTEDRGTVVTVAVAPEGSTIGYTAGWMQKLEPMFTPLPEVETFFVIAGFPTVSQGISFVRLYPWEKRDRSQQEIVQKLMPQATALPGILAFPTNPPSLGRSARAKPVDFVIQTTGTYAELDTLITNVLQKAAEYPGLVAVESDLKLNKPQLSLTLNRDKAAAVGAQVADVGRVLETLLGGRKVTRFKKEGEQYDVIIQVDDSKRASPADLANIYVRGEGDNMIKLSNIIEVKENVAPRELNHFNQLRAAKITGVPAPGYTLDETLKFLEKTVAELKKPGTLTDLDGVSRDFMQSSGSLAFTFFLALCFIYLVLSAQFESFVGPFVILLTVPLSMTGALGLLWLVGGTLNVYTQVGLITLIGLITKHGILIVEFANQLRQQGKDILTATAEAAGLRLRPILMTTGAMVLGAVPLALASGAGAESRSQIGWVIIGGMTVGTFFTLFVIPVVYSLLAKKHAALHSATAPLSNAPATTH